MQGLIADATSYEEQSLRDIQNDIERWIVFTRKIEQLLEQYREEAISNEFWKRVPFDFQYTLNRSIAYLTTIKYDLEVVRNAIISNQVGEMDVNLLFSIGSKATEFNNQYGDTYYDHDVDGYWQEYGNPDFFPVEKMYQEGRDFFVSLQDAANAAVRLQQYVRKAIIVNNSISMASNSGVVQIQQNTNNSQQCMTVFNEFDYEKVMQVLSTIKIHLQDEKATLEFGENIVEMNELLEKTLEAVSQKEPPSKINLFLKKIKSIASDVTSGLIANGIVGLINGIIA